MKPAVFVAILVCSMATPAQAGPFKGLSKLVNIQPKKKKSEQAVAAPVSKDARTDAYTAEVLGRCEGLSDARYTVHCRTKMSQCLEIAPPTGRWDDAGDHRQNIEACAVSRLNYYTPDGFGSFPRTTREECGRIRIESMEAECVEEVIATCLDVDKDVRGCRLGVKDHYTSRAYIETKLAEVVTWYQKNQANDTVEYLSKAPKDESAIVHARAELDKMIAARGADDATVQRYETQLADTLATLNKIRGPLIAKALRNARAPSNQYRGADRSKLAAMIRSDWQEKYPEDRILGLRFHQGAWKREQTKDWNDGEQRWEYSDHSTLTVSVIVTYSDQTAMIYPAYVNRDNTTGALNTGVATKRSGYVSTEILLSSL